MAQELEVRKCVISGKALPKEELLRFIVLRNGEFIPDFNKKLPGRGVYLSNSKKLLESLVEKSPLNKILHKNVRIDENLPQIVEKILANRGLEAINLARKAGDLILGFEKIKEMITKGKAAFVIEAADAGADGRQKMAEMARELEQFILYDVDTFDKALGRENTVYLAVAKSKISPMVRTALNRYQTFLNM